jgi:uncharacterized protein (TIGR01777 family)
VSTTVLVTGATGFLGGHLSSALAEEGVSLAATSRDAARARASLPTGTRVHAWSPEAEPLPAEALEGVSAVVHLLGESVSGRWTNEKKRRILDSRVHSTRNLVAALEAAARRGARPALVSASAIGFYGDRGEDELTEASPGGTDFLAQVCRAWEEEASKAEASGVRVVRARIGLVMGREGGALAGMLPAFRWGAGGKLGPGTQWWPWIHVRDAARLLTRAALDASLSGAINLTSPHPVRQAEFAKTLARTLGRPAIAPAPAFVLKAALGEFSVELLASRKVLPARATSELGFRYEHPELDEALAHLLPR